MGNRNGQSELNNSLCEDKSKGIGAREWLKTKNWWRIKVKFIKRSKVYSEGVKFYENDKVNCTDPSNIIYLTFSLEDCENNLEVVVGIFLLQFYNISSTVRRMG